MNHSGRILIVDDNPAARTLIKEVLTPYHYIFEEAEDGVEGLQKVSAFHPDLILLDIVMPRMDGLKMCEHLQENHRTCDIPVIMLTPHGKCAETFRLLVFEMGLSDFVLKPFQEIDLLARVKRQLEIKKKLDRLMREKEDLALIQKMIHTLYEKKSMHDLLFTLVKKISEIIHVERCSFVRVRDDRETGVVEASSDGPDVRSLEIDLKKYPEILEVLTTKKILIIQDIGKAQVMAAVRKHLGKIRFQSLVLIPVVEEDKIVGTLILRTARRKKTFSERDVRFLEAIAEASRPAILNARLFESMEDRLLNAPTKKGVLTDSPLSYDLPPQDNSKVVMDQIFRLKEEVRRLRRFQQELQEEKSSNPPEDDQE